MVALRDTFATITEAREAINNHRLTNGKSYRFCKIYTKRYIFSTKTRAVPLQFEHGVLIKKVLPSPEL
jgi:hypothetical protein